MRPPALALAVALAQAACTGTIADPPSAGPGGGVVNAPPLAALAATSGLRRLTIREYDDTLHDLLEDDTRPGATLLPADVRSPFDNDYTTQVASQSLIEGAELLATEAAARALADPARRARIVGCTPTSASDEGCFRSFLTTFGRRAFRRTLTAEQVDGYMTLLAFATEDNDFYAAVDAAIRAFLQDPQFLYRIEIGVPVLTMPGVYQLDDFEMASRLSYLLWGSMPNDALLDLAEEGRLSTPDEMRSAARTMLDDARARERIDRFHALWLGYEMLPHAAELSNAMALETNSLVERIVFDERRPWQDLFRSTETFANDFLAEHYGLEPPGSTTPRWISYGTSGRQGILSHGAFLSLGAKFADTSPTQRGREIRVRLLCQTIPDPPPGVDVDNPLPVTEATRCKKERLLAHTQGGCASCHSLMDPIGFGLENYDQAGQYRTTDVGEPECVIDGMGEVAGIGTFQGPAGLEDLLLESNAVNQCVVTQLYRFAVGRTTLDDTDNQLVTHLTDQLGAGDFRFDDLLLGLVGGETFGYRREGP